MSDQPDPTDDPTLRELERQRRADTPRARLLKIAEIPKLQAEAEYFLMFFPEYKHYPARPGMEFESGMIDAAIASLERRAIRWQLAEATGRDARRNAGPKKPRGPKWPELDAWIERRLKRNPELKAPYLWRLLEDEYGESFRVESDELIEETSDRTLAFSGFQARITPIRKRLKKK